MNPPPSARPEDGSLIVLSSPATDFWRRTSYGYVRDNGHFLRAPLEGDAGIELVFSGRFSEQFDQAGLMLRMSPEVWLKTGVEVSDDRLYASAVVTIGASDWSVARIPAVRTGDRITVRVSRVGDAVTVRYRLGGGQLRLLRLAHLPGDGDAAYGPFCCSPTGPGLEVRFHALRIGTPDRTLHDVASSPRPSSA